MFNFYYQPGTEEDEDPTPGNTYWVVISADAVEVAFQSMLTVSIKRDHYEEPDDRTPSYQFANGVIAHGDRIRFYKDMPETPINMQHATEGVE